MFNKGKEKLIYPGRLTQIAMLIILIAGMASCASSQPGEEFLSLNPGIAHSNGIVQPFKEITVKEFIAAANKDGKWKKVDNSQWIYTIKGTDQLTKANNEVAMLFVKEQAQGQDAAILRRVVANGQEMPELVRSNLFFEIVSRIAQAKRTAQ